VQSGTSSNGVFYFSYNIPDSGERTGGSALTYLPRGPRALILRPPSPAPNSNVSYFVGVTYGLQCAGSRSWRAYRNITNDLHAPGSTVRGPLNCVGRSELHSFKGNGFSPMRMWRK